MASIIGWLLPKEKKFFVMLREQASNVVVGCAFFKEMVENYNALGDSEKEDFVKNIKFIENKGDNIAHEIIGSLDKTFVTPIDKEDIHKLAMLLDDVIDLVHAAALRLVIFRIGKINSHIKASSIIILDTVKKIEMGVIGVSKLRTMNRFYIDIHTLENKADDLYHKALEDLFKIREPINVIKYKELYDFMEDIMDKCEDIANVIESIVVKHA